MTTEEKVRLLKFRIGHTATLVRNGDEELSALIQRLHGTGEDTVVFFMDVFEGVERSL